MKYQKWHIGTAAEGDTALLREAGYPGLLATVLASRGITTAEAAAEALAGVPQPPVCEPEDEPDDAALTACAALGEALK